MKPFVPLPRAAIVVLCLLCIAGLYAYFSLSSYWQYTASDSGSQRVVQSVVDSILQNHGLDKDSVALRYHPISDRRSSQLLVEYLGVSAGRNYIERFGLHHTLLRVSALRKTHSNSFTNVFSFGGNLPERRAQPPRQSDGYFTMTITMHGQILEYFEPRTLPAATTSDSAALTELLAQMAPPYFSNKKLNWNRKLDGKHYFSVSAIHGRYDYHSSEIVLFADRPANFAADTSWSLGWSRENIFREQNFMENGGAAMAFAPIIFTIVIAVSILAYFIAFIVQIRKKAVNLWVTLWFCSLLTIYFVSAQLSFMADLNVIGVAAIVFFNFIFLGFLIGGAPASGALSLGQQLFPEKFYSLYRTIRSPWKSHYWGKSVLIGGAAGIFSVLLFPAMVYVLSKFYADYLIASSLFNSALGSLCTAPIPILTSSLLLIPILSLVLTLPGPTIARRYLPVRWRHFAAALISGILSMTMASLQGVPSWPLAAETFMQGLLMYVVFVQADILGVVTMYIVSSTLFFFPFARHQGVEWVFLCIWAILPIAAYISAFATAEQVSEDDYKPEFLERLEEDRRLRDELSAAKVVQQRLLPLSMPKYPSLDIAAYCLPAYEVGGDYYDFFPLSESRLGILIADVSGKGMSAAFYITLAKGLVVSQIHQYNSPAAVLTKVNKLLYETMERGKFISMIYAVVDVETMTMVYAQAGHNPVVQRCADGSALVHNERGLALGLDSGAVFDKSICDHVIKLSPGESAIVYTDGVVEAMSTDAVEFGMERLQNTIRNNSGSAADIVDGIVSALKIYMGKEKQQDDITLIAIKNTREF